MRSARLRVRRPAATVKGAEKASRGVVDSNWAEATPGQVKVRRQHNAQDQPDEDG